MSEATSNTPTAGYELNSELARHCLPASNHDSNRKLAWVNSLCLFFLLIGIVGAKPGKVHIIQPPPIEQAIPVVLEAEPPPATKVEAQQSPEQTEQKTEVPQIVVVTPDMPSINFSIPTIGNVVVPSALAQAPPSAPMKPLTVVQSGSRSVQATGSGGERPEPREYPRLARQLGQQGTVLLSMTADANGSIVTIEVKASSGFPILDRAAFDFVKHHWILPSGTPNQVYEAPIRYVLEQ